MGIINVALMGIITLVRYIYGYNHCGIEEYNHGGTNEPSLW